MELQRNERGEFDSYAWPGGYPLFYVTDDCACLCPDCANGKNGSEASENAEPRTGWKLVGVDVNWEDPELYCDHCNKRIESAYAD